MKTSIATVCLSGTLEEKMHASAQAGFDGVEIFEQDLVVSALSPAEIRALADRLCLTLDLYQPFRNLEGVTEELFQDNLRRLEATFQLMGELGMTMILVPSNTDTATIDDDEVVADQLRRAAELAATYNIQIAFEALAWGTYINRFWHSWEVVREANHPNLGICIDSFHILAKKDEPARIAEIPGDKIFFVQLADAPTVGMDILPLSRHHRVFPGEGDLDVVGLTTKLFEAGYSGPLSLEIFNDVFRETSPIITAQAGLRSLLWLQQQVKGQLAPTSEARQRLVSLPKIDPPYAVDFTEITTNAPDVVGQLLKQLGFVFHGQHRRKSVQLFTAGSTRIVVNHTATTTTRISTMGIRVADASEALERALTLGAEQIPRPVTTNEHQLPGVFIPGGVQLQFVDKQTKDWVNEFGLDTEDPETETIQLDHVNFPVAAEYFDAAVLFTQAALRLGLASTSSIPSRRGLVHSKVLSSQDANITWIYNHVPPAFTGTEGLPTKYPGHLGLEVDDVETLAITAAERGLKILPVPQNYYRDLAIRFDIEESTLARWAELGIFYDRNDDGEFLHFYTETVGEIFVEVIERRDGYTDFAAGNAAVRLAAQDEFESTH